MSMINSSPSGISKISEATIYPSLTRHSVKKMGRISGPSMGNLLWIRITSRSFSEPEHESMLCEVTANRSLSSPRDQIKKVGKENVPIAGSVLTSKILKPVISILWIIFPRNLNQNPIPVEHMVSLSWSMTLSRMCMISWNMASTACSSRSLGIEILHSNIHFSPVWRIGKKSWNWWKDNGIQEYPSFRSSEYGT